MKNRINLQLNLFQKQLNLHKQRFNKSPPTKNQLPIHSMPTSDAIVDFHFQRYPFQNKQTEGSRFLKTTLAGKIDQNKLQKLMTITHPNLINVIKIVRGQPKEPSNSHTAAYFSFYFEAVRYSLKRMAAMSESQGRMMREMGNINFGSVLKEVTEYFIDHGIYHQIKLDDIGVDERFHIKIYLSPAVACGLEGRQSTMQQILKNNQSLMNWWKTTFPFRQTSLESHNLTIPRVESYENLDRNIGAEMIKSNKSSFIVGENSQIIGEDDGNIDHGDNIDQMKISMPQQNFKNLNFSNKISKPTSPNGLVMSIKHNTQNKRYDTATSPNDLNCSQKTFKSQLTRISQLQQAKMKKIHDEVQKIKKNVKRSSMDHKLRKESDHIILEKMKAINKTVNNPQKQIFQSAKFGKSKQNPEVVQIQQNKYNCQSIQQNINCINIYNQPPHSGNIRHKNILSVPVFSYNIIPANGGVNRNIVVTPHRLSQRNIEPTNDRSNTDNGSNASFDLQQNKLTSDSIPFRHSLQPSDDHPLINFRKIDKPSQQKSNQIKVTTKNVTQSAGPLQFKNIINKFIKPQFAAKKSHIYEDPHEDQSQHSISKHDIMIKQSIKLTANKQEKNASIEKYLQHQRTKKQYQTHITGMKKASHGHKDNICNDRIHKANDLKNQKSQNNLFKKAQNSHFDENSLNSRIKEVLQKTKNAIQLLNRVKSNKSIKRRDLSRS